ncbi:BQ2448_4396 [Microbotryum intermedium]|uniref:BQ2448_4396 protein n=1 Tax=Microbotryum intermedium TaxID=269621 RepID=A0A238FJ90_9BASI|nr:BQ2448_4396 [Microbotryum intermedium]
MAIDVICDWKILSLISAWWRAYGDIRNVACWLSFSGIACFDGQSALLGHELAYCLGQINDPYALPILQKVLENDDEHPMVRHEAAEAMGAISDLSSIPILKKYLDHPIAAIRETAEIAVAKIEWDNSEQGKKERRPNEFNPINCSVTISDYSLRRFRIQSLHHHTGSKITIPESQSTFNDTIKSLSKRYRAMFALHNDGSEAAELAASAQFGDARGSLRYKSTSLGIGMDQHGTNSPALFVLRYTQEQDMGSYETRTPRHSKECSGEALARFEAVCGG